jgi:hypothetical protein
MIHDLRRALVLTLAGAALVACGSADDASDSVGQAEEALRPIGGGGLGDDPPPTVLCYADADGDGLRTGLGRRFADACPTGYSSRKGDCDDRNANVRLGAACYADNDGDGYGGAFSAYSCGACPAGKTTNASDCNDAAAGVHPIVCHRDEDGDGRAGQDVVVACASSCAAAGYGDTVTDCNDASGAIGATLSCDVDSDGDGFTSTVAMCAAACPSVTSDGNDCNDANGSIHELTTEVAGNGVDDNCNGLVDETIFDYAENASLSASRSVHLAFTVSNPSVLARVAAGPGALYANVKFRKLTNTAAPSSVVLPWLPAPSSRGTTGEIELSGLDPATIYMVSLEFLDEHQAATFAPSGTDRDGAPTHSEEYLTMTTAEGGDALAAIRPLIVLKTFYQRMRFERGWVTNGDAYCGGYSCDVDRGGDAWCSEYYDSMIDAWLKDVSVTYPLHMQASNVVDYFRGYGSYGDISVPYLLANFGRPGDYIAMGDNGSIHHSSMFLAYDEGTRSYWHIDGNSSARVRVGQDYAPTQYYGVGYLTPGMLR